MKKRLLFAAFAMVGALNASAFEVGDYVYTTSQRLKITGDNLVQNGNFAAGLGEGGWVSSAADGSVNPDVWGIVNGEGPNGEDALQSKAATEGESLCNVWSTLTGGTTYIVSFDIKAEADGNSSSVGETIGTNYVGFFLNGDGNLTQVATADDAPVAGVATSFLIKSEWQTTSFVFTPDEGQQLVMHLERLATGTLITNISIHPVDIVFDDRIALNKLAFADKLLNDPNFNTEQAQAAKEEFVGSVYAALQEMVNTPGALDDPSEGEGVIEAFDQMLGDYLDASSRRMNDQLAGTDNVESLAVVGRGANRPATYANLDLWGGNWGHVSGADYLQSSIQNGYAHSATYNVFNKYFPAGKYYFTAEIRNANTGKDSWPTTPTFNLETVCKIFVGSDTLNTDTIAGEAFQKFYIVGEITEEGAFRAGVEWPGVSSGGSFFIKNVEVRAFGDADEIIAKIEHSQAFETYTTQYNAAVSAYEAVRTKVDNGNYPWDQQVLRDAKAKYDPIFDAHRAKGWIDADGNDTGVASTEELNDWALYQDVEEYSTSVDAETGVETQTRLEYQIVRGYQAASNTVIATNQVITDLANAIDAAKATRNLGAYATGDRETYKAAILKAIESITTIRSNTTDATRVADSTSLRAAQDELAAATEAFLASVSLKPFADIDFSKGVTVETDPESGADKYVAYGEAGSIVLGNYEDTAAGTNGTSFALGRYENDAVSLPDVLRIGNGTATVTVPEDLIPGDESTFRATFDIWFGNLSGKNTYVELRNAAGERVAGFSLNRYNGSLAYNDFNDVLSNGGTGMNVLQYATGVGSSSASNTAICVDNNRTSFDLTINYANGTVQGTMVNPQRGTNEGAEQPLNAALTDNKVTQFVVGSNYNNGDRRCWFDNLKLYSFVGGNLEEDIMQSPWAEVSGIATVNAAQQFNGAIYSLQGVRLNAKPNKGIYIMNGKKYVVK
ncbi:MAG: hypothetical protein IJ841_04250 [Prevotella sp.]|nr:hypothetical protein [Prevotella sp.]